MTICIKHTNYTNQFTLIVGMTELPFDLFIGKDEHYANPETFSEHKIYNFSCIHSESQDKLHLIIIAIKFKGVSNNTNMYGSENKLYIQRNSQHAWPYASAGCICSF